LVREEVERLNVQLKREAIKSYRYQAFSDRFVGHIQTHSRKAGKVSLRRGCMVAGFLAVCSHGHCTQHHRRAHKDA